MVAKLVITLLHAHMHEAGCPLDVCVCECVWSVCGVCVCVYLSNPKGIVQHLSSIRTGPQSHPLGYLETHIFKTPIVYYNITGGIGKSAAMVIHICE